MREFDHIKSEDLIGKAKFELLYELLFWDYNAHEKDLDLIARKIIEFNEPWKKSLWLICFSQSSFASGFTDKYYLFDEDKTEIHHQIKKGMTLHLGTIILILGIIISLYIAFGNIGGISLILLLMYLFMVIKQTQLLFQAVEKKILSSYRKKTNANKSYI